MFDLSSVVNLPFIWAGIIATAIFIYVLLDGFDLGIGILFPFAPSDKCRNRMMNSIAPFWDGNETWLVLGGGGLFAAFPLAYAILLPAFYMPITLMLLGLILRGVAFEFRFKSKGYAIRMWDYAFHIGSLMATFCQGAMLGAFLQGITVTGRNFSGGPFDWVSAYSVMIGFALIAGYALIGATWLVMKTEDTTQKWARQTASYVLGLVGFFLIVVSIAMPLHDTYIQALWFSTPTVYYLLPLPLLAVAAFILLWRDLHQKKHENRPFFVSLSIFLTAYVGLAISVFPWIIPYRYSIWEAAASGPSLSLMLVGVVPLLPLILGYTAYAYYIFRGKSSHEHHGY